MLSHSSHWVWFLAFQLQVDSLNVEGKPNELNLSLLIKANMATNILDSQKLPGG
jgi:hypothetical protein